MTNEYVMNFECKDIYTAKSAVYYINNKTNFGERFINASVGKNPHTGKGIVSIRSQHKLTEDEQSRIWAIIRMA